MTDPATNDVPAKLAEWLGPHRAQQALHLLDRLERQLRHEARWRWLRRIGVTGLVALSVGIYLSVYAPILGWNAGAGRSSVVVVSLRGVIGHDELFSASHVVPILRRLCSRSSTETLVLHIDSPGGAPAEAERIADEVRYCRTEQHKRIETVFDSVGASAAYLIAVESDWIDANPYAVVGSIGAVISYLEVGDGLKRVGVQETVFASGPMKAMLSPYRANTPAQADVAQEVVNELAGRFRAAVEKRRGDHLAADPQLWTGRVFTAEKAKALGLIDEVSPLEAYLRQRHPGVVPAAVTPTRSVDERLSLKALFEASRDVLSARGEPTWSVH